MAHSTTPHTQSGQNQGFEESDREGRLSEQPVARGEDAYTAGTDGAQTGTNRGGVHAPGTGPSHHGSHPIETVLEGTVETRAPQGEGQGITNRSQTEESVGQSKVVKDRPDVQSGINHVRQEDDVA